MGVCVIAGGVGSARFCAGLCSVLDPAEVTVVVNVADDARMRGLYVCPDVDTVLYHLAGLTDWDRGWGMAEESYTVDERYRELVARAGDTQADVHEWFTLGDRDLATNLLRSRLLEAGRSLSEATDVLRRAMGIDARVIPATDDPVRTEITTASGETLDFQTYFVRRHHADEVAGVDFRGAEDATPAPGVLEAIGSAETVVVPPSNPIVSIAPVLAVPGIRERIDRDRCVAISPIVGGRAIKGPAASLMASLGGEVSPVGVARIYREVAGTFVLDRADAALAADVEVLGMRAIVKDTIMSGPAAAARLAKEIRDEL